MLAYFRQVYGGRVETTAEGEAYVVALTDEALCVEDMHLAWSRDGLHWTALNGNRPTLPTPAWARHARDPFVRRGPDGLFHLLATGGRAPTDVLYGRSEDLITWEDLRSVSLVGGVCGGAQRLGAGVGVGRRARQLLRLLVHFARRARLGR